ncbi:MULTISPECIES: hypothetical protein [Paenibacillus]|uniref:hypothetical protein n=1 Tax=Paenibacillus TaxID=44249 RepID=UPI000AB5B262|nr:MULTISPECIES: hypothetical protein [Paenibacillus]MDH6672691.1 hypothetical protein [Paenibacillus sp. LBL]
MPSFIRLLPNSFIRAIFIPGRGEATDNQNPNALTDTRKPSDNEGFPPFSHSVIY